MQSFVRAAFLSLIMSGISLPPAFANEGGGGGGHDPPEIRKGTVKQRKNSDCDELARLKEELNDAKRKAERSRSKLVQARDDLADAEDDKDAPRATVRLLRKAVRYYVAGYEIELRTRDQLQKRYDKLRRACA